MYILSIICKIVLKEFIKEKVDSDDFFFFKQKTADDIGVRLVGSEMCIRDSVDGDVCVAVSHFVSFLVLAHSGQRLALGLSLIHI